MPTHAFSSPVDSRDVDDAKRLFVRAFRRRPRAEAIDVVMSVSFGAVAVIMDGLTEALGAEQAKSIMEQMIGQAADAISKGEIR